MHTHSQNEHHHPANGTPDELATCPVMHMPVNKNDAESNGLTRTLDGKKYYFCCNTCTDTFDKAPQAYLAHP